MPEQEISKAGQVAIADTSDVVQPSQPDISQGFPDTVNQPVQTPENAPEGATTPEQVDEGVQTPTRTPETPESVTERLKQQNAQKDKLLASLGIDPLSDIAEQLEQGLITEDMVRQHVAAKYQTPVQQQQQTPAQDLSPVAVAEQNLADARAKYQAEVKESGSVSLETNEGVLNAIQAVNDAKLAQLTNQIVAEKESQQVNESVEAVISVARNNPEYAKMEAPLQQANEQVLVAVTGMLADQKAKAMGIDPRTLTPQQYHYFGNEANNMLGTLADHFRNLGRQEAKAGFTPNATVTPRVNTNVNPNLNVAPTPQIVPANNDGSPIPVANPFANVNHLNHREAAKEYAKRSKGVM